MNTAIDGAGMMVQFFIVLIWCTTEGMLWLGRCVVVFSNPRKVAL